MNYLKAARCEVGLLLNFGARSLEYKRYIFTPEMSQANGEESTSSFNGE